MIEKRHISYSEYSAFKRCQHKYYLTYKLGFKSPENETLFLGNVIHSTLEYIALNKAYDAKNVFLNAINKNLEKIKDLQFIDLIKSKQDEYYGIFSIIEKSLDFHNRFKSYKVIHVEYKLYYPLFNYEDVDWHFKGFIDLILYSEEEDCFYFIDWKTANKPWDLKKKLQDKDFIAQINLYKYFYAKEHNISFDKIKTKYISLVYSTGIVQELEVNYPLIEIENLVLELKQTIIDIQSINKNRLSKMRHNPKKKILCNWCSLYNTRLCNDFLFQKFNENDYIN